MHSSYDDNFFWIIPYETASSFKKLYVKILARDTACLF